MLDRAPVTFNQKVMWALSFLHTERIFSTSVTVCDICTWIAFTKLLDRGRWVRMQMAKQPLGLRLATYQTLCTNRNPHHVTSFSAHVLPFLNLKRSTDCNQTHKSKLLVSYFLFSCFCCVYVMHEQTQAQQAMYFERFTRPP